MKLIGEKHKQKRSRQLIDKGYRQRSRLIDKRINGKDSITLTDKKAKENR